MARKPARPTLVERTPVAEWTAAALGGLLTLGVLAYSLWEGLGDRTGPPALSVSAEPAKAVGGGFVVPITVRNAAAQTAAQVQVTGVLTAGEGAPEERSATFSYVAGHGETRGGLVFRTDPAAGELELAVEGFEEP